MPLLRKLPKIYRARVESAANQMMRLHGERAWEIAREASKSARRRHHTVTARFWSLVAYAISSGNIVSTLDGNVPAIVQSNEEGRNAAEPARSF
jgi:hypothetical protein